MATIREEMAGAAPKTRSGRIAQAVSRGPLHVFLIGMGLLWLVPAAGLFVTSFRSAADSRSSGWWTAFTDPGQLTLEPYRDILSDGDFVGSIWNTVLISVPTSILVVLVAALAAYAFAWIDFKGREPLFLFVVALLVVPLQMALIPVARLYGQVGLFGTIPGAILFHIAFGLPFAIFLLRNFFIGIPSELLEAARIDGASELGIFTRIVLPLGMPAIAALFIFQFLWTWNDLLVALVFTTPESAPMTMAIRDQLRQFGSNFDVIGPGAFIQMIVPLVVFFSFQRYFVQGLLAGSVK